MLEGDGESTLHAFAHQSKPPWRPGGARCFRRTELELCFESSLEPAVRADLGYGCAADALRDPRGHTVRCTPARRTVMGPNAGGRSLVRKLQQRRAGAMEWRHCAELERLGFRVPARICLARSGRRSALLLERVPGRPMDALLREAVLGNDAASATSYCIDVVAPLVRRLHEHGLFHRDLYWNHLFARSLAARAEEPWLIDVGRLLRPRWRRTRWRIKDLAGLLASTPAGYSRTAMLRFLLRYLGDARRSWRPMARAIARKAARIRRHRPKYG